MAHLVGALMVGIGSLQPEAVKEPTENEWTCPAPGGACWCRWRDIPEADLDQVVTGDAAADSDYVR